MAAISSLLCLLLVSTALLGLSVDAGAMRMNITRSNNVCPDQSECPGDETCCLLPDGTYGCCPYAGGVCCPDMTTCCPEGTTCAGGGMCSKQNEPITAQLLVTAGGTRKPQDDKGEYSMSSIKIIHLSEDRSNDKTVCPDGSQCAGTQTCCRTPAGVTTCCPLAFGVCCADGLHCCPLGSRCDGSSTQCLSSDKSGNSAGYFIQAIQPNNRKNKQL